MSSHHCARSSAFRNDAGGRPRVGSDPRCFVRQVIEEERRRYPARTGPPEPGDGTDG